MSQFLFILAEVKLKAIMNVCQILIKLHSTCNCFATFAVYRRYIETFMFVVRVVELKFFDAYVFITVSLRKQLSFERNLGL